MKTLALFAPVILLFVGCQSVPTRSSHNLEVSAKWFCWGVTVKYSDKVEPISDDKAKP